jgi:hypothetical protein
MMHSIFRRDHQGALQEQAMRHAKGNMRPQQTSPPRVSGIQEPMAQDGKFSLCIVFTELSIMAISLFKHGNLPMKWA